MILFLSQLNDELFQNFAEKFSKTTGIKIEYKSINDILFNSTLALSCTNNEYSSKLDGIDFNNFKVCLINYEYFASKEFFNELDNDLDKDYASQEWNAALLCLFQTAEKTKIVNRVFKRYGCNTELEHMLLFQRFGLDTIDIFLTNNTTDFLTIRELFNGNVLIKTPICGYEKSKTFSHKESKKLDKLHFSPYIFQKSQVGINSLILSIGDTFLIYQDKYPYFVEIPVGLKEKLLKLKKELGLSIAIFSALYDNDKFYFYSLTQSFTYSAFYNIFKQKLDEALTNFILKEYNN